MNICAVENCQRVQESYLCYSHNLVAKKAKYPLYSTLAAMKGRCSTSTGKSALTYHARGIRVCARWSERYPNGIENFTADMGPKPSPEHSIDRIDNDKGYEPGNCRWATAKEQATNKRRNTGTDSYR